MHAGLPVIVSNNYELRKFVEEYNVGYVIEDVSSQGVYNTIKDISKKDKDRFKDNLKKASGLFNWDIEEKKLIDAYNGLFEN